MRTVQKRCETRIVIGRSRPARVARRVRVALEQRVLGLGVERRRRLVEHEEQRALAHEAARERELLPLAEGDLDAARPGRAELRVEPAGSRATTSSRPARATAAVDRRRIVEARDVADADGWRAGSSKRKKSWNAPASRARQSSARMRASGAPSTRMRPAVGSYSSQSSFTSVLLPAPFSPTSATTAPAGSVEVRRRRARGARCRDRRTTRARAGCPRRAARERRWSARVARRDAA